MWRPYYQAYYSVLTVLLNSKRTQLSACFLVRKNDGQIFVLPWIAVDEENKKRYDILRIGNRDILDLRTPLNADLLRYYIDQFVEDAKCESRPAVMACNVPIKVPGVPVEPFGTYGSTADCAGQPWPEDWEEQGKNIVKNYGYEFEGTLLKRMLKFDHGNDLVKTFHAACWLADRFGFFKLTPEDEKRRLLNRSGALPIYDDAGPRGSSLKQWRQPHVAGPPSAPSPLARPKLDGTAKSIFAPGYKGRG